MQTPFNFLPDQELVTSSELERLTPRSRLLWAASCVGSICPLLPPWLSNILPVQQSVKLVVGVMMDRESDLSALRQLSDYFEENSTPLLENNLFETKSISISEMEIYSFHYYVAPWSIVDMVLHPHLASVHAEAAVEASGVIYKNYQYSRQGFWGGLNETADYGEKIASKYYKMTRELYAKIINSSLIETSIADNLVFPWDCEPLSEELLEACRRLRPLPPRHERWLRETGFWLGPP